MRIMLLETFPMIWKKLDENKPEMIFIIYLQIELFRNRLKDERIF